jgi:sec-independent protein translocase protein TatA
MRSEKLRDAVPQAPVHGLEELLQETNMLGKLGLPEILVIAAIALLIFGPGRLSELGKGLGEGIRNFKGAVKDPEPPAEKKE